MTNPHKDMTQVSHRIWDIEGSIPTLIKVLTEESEGLVDAVLVNDGWMHDDENQWYIKGWRPSTPEEIKARRVAARQRGIARKRAAEASEQEEREEYARLKEKFGR